MRATLVVAAIFLGCLTAQAVAQDLVQPPDSGQQWATGKDEFTLHFENDVLGLDDSDQHYSNGLQLAWQSGGPRLWGWLDDWIRNGFLFDADTVLHGRIALGQNIFTPEDLENTELIVADRPYAGWLHLDMAALGCNERTLDVLELSVGMVGPAAGGKEMQKWFHQIIDSPDPQGWHNQINNELAVLVAYGRRWRNMFSPRRAPLLGGLGLQVDMSPHVDLAFGNVYTYGGAGATLRLGKGLDGDFGPPRIRPAPPGAGFQMPGKQLGIYGFAGLTGRAMLHNIFLDGNTFSDSHSVDREIWVGDFHWGFVFSGLGIRLATSYVVRSREFTRQTHPDHFGAITFSVRF